MTPRKKQEREVIVNAVLTTMEGRKPLELLSAVKRVKRHCWWANEAEICQVVLKLLADHRLSLTKGMRVKVAA